MEALCVGTDTSVLIVGDASATTADRPGAWATVVYDRGRELPHFLLGTESNCPINRGELAAHVQGLWFASHVNLLTPKSVVLCVSDSEVTVKGGKREYARGAHAAAWASVDVFERAVGRLDWRWVPRNSNPVNSWCDRAAGELRLVMKDHLAGLVESAR